MQPCFSDVLLNTLLLVYPRCDDGCVSMVKACKKEKYLSVTHANVVQCNPKTCLLLLNTSHDIFQNDRTFDFEWVKSGSKHIETPARDSGGQAEQPRFISHSSERKLPTSRILRFSIRGLDHELLRNSGCKHDEFLLLQWAILGDVQGHGSHRECLQQKVPKLYPGSQKWG